MPRPKSFDHAAAIETAMQEIWRNGYQASSVNALSKELGITRSSYYNAFGSREGLLREVLDHYLSQSPDRVLHGEPPASPVLTLLTDTFREICTVRARDPGHRGCLAVNCIAELADRNTELGAFLVSAVSTSAARFTQLLDIAVDRGELPAGTDTHAQGLALQNLLMGINIFAKALHDEAELWMVAKTTLEGLGLYKEHPNAQL
ncbi:MAG: TetR/AcrR family transcriptional regulator [Pseudomonadota bacterium]